MGSCGSHAGKKSDVDDKDQTLTKQDIELVRHSWKFVVKGGLATYGTNMMVWYVLIAEN